MRAAMPVSVRPASLDDLDSVAPLFDAYRRFYGQPGDLRRAHDWLNARVSRGESTVLVAERGGNAVGFVQLYPMFSSVRTARIWILNDLYVAADARRSGIARGLLDAAAKFAREDGAAGIALETGRDNTAAQALYRQAGWSQESNLWFSCPL